MNSAQVTQTARLSDGPPTPRIGTPAPPSRGSGIGRLVRAVLRRAPVGSRANPVALKPVYAQQPHVSPFLQQIMASPFYRDTMRALPSVEPQVRSTEYADYEADEDTPLDATVAHVSRNAPRTIVFDMQEPGFGEYTMSHEMSHVMDLNPLPPQQRAMVNRIKNQALGTNREEHFARVMAKTIDRIRNHEPLDILGSATADSLFQQRLADFRKPRRPQAAPTAMQQLGLGAAPSRYP